MPDGRANDGSVATVDSRTEARERRPSKEPHVRRVACTQCRQSKLRCDSATTPCSRCERLGLTCEKDARYKRVSKKSKIDDLEKQVQHLRTVMGQVQSPPPNGVPSALTPVSDRSPAPISTPPTLPPLSDATASADRSRLASVPFILENNPIARPGIENTPINPGPTSLSVVGGGVAVPRHSRPAARMIRAIDSTALGLGQIDSLFQLFFGHYHPFFPLLDPSQSPDQYYDICPLLFWTIISVAARRYSEDPKLLMILSRSVTKLAWDTISAPPLHICAVQALLVQCIWPFPSMRMRSDASASFTSIAISAAMHLGLHRPAHAHCFWPSSDSVFASGNRPDRTKTWAACNIVAEYTIMNCGYPSAMSCFDWSIDRACETGNPYSLPDDLRFHLIVQRFCHRITKAMSGNVSHQLGLPSENERYILINLLETEIDSAEGQFQQRMTLIDEIYLWATRLYLRLFYFFDSSLADQRRAGVLKAYAAAATLISKVVSADASVNLLAYSPIFILRMLCTVGSVLFKVLSSSFSQFVDANIGATLFNSTISAMRQCSVAVDDLAMRAANILEQLSKTTAKTDEEPSLVIQSRLGASIFFDCLWRFKEKEAHASSAANTNVNSAGTGPIPQRNPHGDEQMAEAAPQLSPNPMAMTWGFDDFGLPWPFDVSSIMDNGVN